MKRQPRDSIRSVRRRFESASRRPPGVDPATFATELGILAVRGFENMGERARDLMVRNKFIAAQQSYALRQHLEGASADASIGDIVDSCRVWESHTEAGYGEPDLKFPHTISQVAEGTQSQVGSIASDMLQERTGLLLPTPALSPPRVTRSSSDCELLIQRIMDAVCPGRSVIQERSQGPGIELGLRSLLPVKSIPEMDVPTLVSGLEGRVDPSSAVPLGPVLEVYPPVRGWDRVCFSCGHQGHGVSRMDTSFPFLLAGWSVGVRNGRYRATRTSVDGQNYTPGKGGWSGREGSASRIIGDRGATDPGRGKRVLGGRQPAWQQPVGGARGSHWTPDVQAFPALGSHSTTDAGWRERPFSDNGGDVADGGTAKLPISTSEMGDPTRGMRPAGAGRSSPLKPVVDLSDVRGNAVGRPLSVEAPEFSPALGPRTRGMAGSVALSSVAGIMARSILPDYLFRWWLG